MPAVVFTSPLTLERVRAYSWRFLYILVALFNCSSFVCVVPQGSPICSGSLSPAPPRCVGDTGWAVSLPLFSLWSRCPLVCRSCPVSPQSCSGGTAYVQIELWGGSRRCAKSTKEGSSVF